MENRNIVIGVIAVVIVVAIIGWAGGWFGGGQAPTEATAPAPTTTEQPATTPPATTEPAAPATPPAPRALPSLEEIERGHILAALEHAGWVIEGPRGAAAILKLHPNTLRSRMDKLGIKRSGHGRS